jgi:hypothetical protein
MNWKQSAKPKDWPTTLDWRDPNNTPKDGKDVLIRKLTFLLDACRVKDKIPEELKPELNLVTALLRGRTFNKDDFTKAIDHRRDRARIVTSVEKMNVENPEVALKHMMESLRCIAERAPDLLTKVSSALQCDFMDKALAVVELVKLPSGAGR